MSKRPATQMTLARVPHGEATPSATHATELSGRELEAARRRIIGAASVVGGIMLSYFIAYQSVWSEHESPVGFYVASLSTVLLAAVGLYVWRSEPTRQRLVAAAVVLHVVLGVALSIMEPFNVVPTEQPYTLISWNCVNILLVPALLPAGARFVVAFSFALASMTAVGLVALGDVSEVSQLSTSVGASLWLPPFACALVVAVPAGMMSRHRQELSSARRLGAYALVERIGEGGMGEVWRATHRFLRRPAAIKVLRPELLGHSDDARARSLVRFEREAQAIATLESPHTIKLFDFGVADDGSLFYVMELLRGIDLQQLVDELGPVPPERAVHLLLQACDSLNEAHGAGLVHRDIKPSNLFVGPRATDHDVLRVLDFGLVMQRAGDETGTTESGGQIQGTPSTIAPEAALGEVEVDGRADLYALGCVAFFLVTGRPVFDAKTPLRMIALHVTEPPIAPSSCSPHEIPAGFDEVVLACLAKDPNARPATAAELGARLRNIRGLAAWTPAQQQHWWQTILPNV